MKKTYMPGILALILFSYLLLFPAQSLSSVREGLLLWYRSVLPVLFPFMVLSGIVIRFGLTEQLPTKFTRPICHLFHCSHQGSLAVIAGFLCGFPIGAKMTCDLQKRNLISSREADHLHGFVNNVSPAFLISYLAGEQLRMPKYRVYFLFCVLGGAVLYGLFTRPESIPETSPASARRARSSFACSILDECIQDGITSVLKLGAYITLFSLISSMAETLLPEGQLLHAALAGILEITGGTSKTAVLNIPWLWKGTWLCALCAFGGLSAFAQTVSIASMNRRTACRYIKSRVAVTLLAVLLSIGVLLLDRLFSFCL